MDLSVIPESVWLGLAEGTILPFILNFLCIPTAPN